jgi:hypothetical protein
MPSFNGVRWASSFPALAELVAHDPIFAAIVPKATVLKRLRRDSVLDMLNPPFGVNDGRAKQLVTT